MRPILVNSRSNSAGRVVVDAAIARAAGRDAGNRAMRAAGRSTWNEDDWAAACETFDRLIALAGEPAPVRRIATRRKAA
jgi:hypothetical protein